MEAFEHAASLIEHTASQGSRLSLGVADLSGLVEGISGRLVSQVGTLAELREATTALLHGNASMAEATAAIERAAAEAHGHTLQSRAALAEATAEVRTLAGTIEGIGAEASGLEQALQSVARIAASIEAIARQTNLLALNAAIEAAHAGAWGLGFNVVAAEVKQLALQTASASGEIRTTVEGLRTRTQGVLGRTQAGVQQAGAVVRGSEVVASAVGRAGEMLSVIQGAAQDAATGTREVTASCGDLDRSMAVMVEGVGASSTDLQRARAHVLELVGISEALVSAAAESGAVTDDTRFIARVQADAAQVEALLEAALERREIDEEALFDEDHQPIPGSNPVQLSTRFLALTDRLLPPVLEAALSFDARVVYCAAVDRTGYLPTHNRVFSGPQGPDPVWNASHCRNRRRLGDRVGLGAGRNRRAFLLQSYRRDVGGGQFALVKDVSAPIMVRGRHWGALRLAYQA